MYSDTFMYRNDFLHLIMLVRLEILTANAPFHADISLKISQGQESCHITHRNNKFISGIRYILVVLYPDSNKAMSKGPRTLHTTLQKMQLSSIHTSTCCHNCNNFFNSSIYGQRFFRQMFTVFLCSVLGP